MEQDRLLRIKQIIPAILPISRSAFWLGVKTGKYPAPVKLGPRTTCWRESEIMAMVQRGGDLPG
ncbi:MAG: AlpA family phage regulatory protein [Deltaproteobacteria bacterium]|nr:AlpA family phage regulatory protein [Deltaproteobacteria bacterium]